MPTTTSRRARAATRLKQLNYRARARIYLKDPLEAERNPRLYGDVIVSRDNLITPGPTSSRFIVVDYDPQTDRVERPARSKLVTAGAEKVLEFPCRRGSPQEAQVNAWATAVDALDLFQQALALGREVPWAFEGSRLRILPHASCEANAFYNRDTRALHFGYFYDPKGRLIKTSLSHDVVAHETAHAVLDGLRPFYLDAHEPDTGAFHEFIGDLAAMLSLFRDQRTVVDVAQGDNFGDLVSSLAPQVGAGLYGDADRNFLRTARNSFTYDDVRDVVEVHKRSQVLTGFAFDVFEAIYHLRLKDKEQKASGGKLTRRDRIAALLVAARRNMVRLFIRPLDFLPPGAITFHEYVDILLRLDERQYPNDALGYRREIKRVAKARGVLPPPSWTRPPEISNRELLQRDINQIRSSRVGAYRFLNANRPLFGIPEHVDFRVVALTKNLREADDGVIPPPETFIQYVWDQYVDGRAAGLKDECIVLRPGGTLVVDDNVNVQFWTPQFYDEPRVTQVMGHVQRLMERREIDTVPRRHTRSDRLVEALREQPSGALALRLNTSLMHRDRNLL
jgi:hypothetical protein